MHLCFIVDEHILVLLSAAVCLAKMCFPPLDSDFGNMIPF